MLEEVERLRRGSGNRTIPKVLSFLLDFSTYPTYTSVIQYIFQNPLSVQSLGTRHWTRLLLPHTLLPNLFNSPVGHASWGPIIMSE